MEKGYRIGVITWLAAGEGYSREYVNAVRRVKRAWVRENLPQATEVHVVKYGTPKHRVAANANGVLVDDNKDVLAKWPGRKVSANGLITSLREMLYA